MKRRAFLASLAAVPFLAGAALEKPQAHRYSPPIRSVEDLWPKRYRYSERRLCDCGDHAMFGVTRHRCGYQCWTCGGWSWSRDTARMDLYNGLPPTHLS